MNNSTSVAVMVLLYLNLVSCVLVELGLKNSQMPFFHQLSPQQQAKVLSAKKNIDWYKGLDEDSRAVLLYSEGYVDGVANQLAGDKYDEGSLQSYDDFVYLSTLSRFLLPNILLSEESARSVENKISHSLFQKIGSWFTAKKSKYQFDPPLIEDDPENILAKRLLSGDLNLPDLIDEMRQIGISEQNDWNPLLNKIKDYTFQLRSVSLVLYESRLYLLSTAQQLDDCNNQGLENLHTFCMLAEDTVIPIRGFFWGTNLNCLNLKRSVQKIAQKYAWLRVFISSELILSYRQKIKEAILKKNFDWLLQVLEFGIQPFHLFLFVYCDVPEYEALPETNALMIELDGVNDCNISPKLQLAVRTFLQNYLYFLDLSYQHNTQKDGHLLSVASPDMLAMMKKQFATWQIVIFPE